MEANETRALHQIHAYKEILEKLVPSAEGAIIQFFGDGCLLVFDSSTHAVQCAIELQKAFLAHEIPVRMGMHLGEILIKNGNAFGIGVNIASRIESISVPGAVLISKTVRDQFRNKTDFTLESLGSFEFKNVGEPIEVFALVSQNLTVPKKDEISGKLKVPAHISKLKSRFSNASILLTVSAILILTYIGFNSLNNTSDIEWVEKEAIPTIIQLTDSNNYQGAFDLLRQAQKKAPLHSKLQELSSTASEYISLNTQPAAAKVYRNALGSDSGWQYVGETPLDSLQVFRGESLWRFQKEGYDPVIRLNKLALGSWYWPKDTIRLFKKEEIPEGMVYVPSSWSQLRIPGLLNNSEREIPGFFLDRYEITNKAYQEFVRSGGYSQKKFWKYPFVQDGKNISWEEAMALFVDKTNRHGPADWLAGTYPEGTENYPVGGISWYEAQAYASFVEKRLPTVYHFNVATEINEGMHIIPYSNLSNKGRAAVGEYESIGCFGTYDLLGNVREWLHSKPSGNNTRFILGGAWGEPFHAAQDALAKDPFDRSLKNGFRCMKYHEQPALQEELEKNIKELSARKGLQKPVNEEIFATYLRQYDYDPSPLFTEISQESTGNKNYSCEKVTINAAYGGERMDIYCFFPKNSKRPFQPIVVFPDAGALFQSQFKTKFIKFLPGEFLLNSGRAVIYPIYKGTFERRDGVPNGFPNESNFYKDHVIMWIKDFKRTVDYLESREDIDKDKLAFFGSSWGGIISGILPAVEKRIKVVVSISGGLAIQSSLPEVDQLNYLTRIKQPFLMLNGKYDFIFPLEKSQKPMFDLLGTSSGNKRHILSESTHLVRQDELIKQTLDWLDTYVGK